MAGEAAAVLHLHERTDTVEPGVGLDAPDRAHVARDRRSRVLAPSLDHPHVRRKAAERLAGEIRPAAGDVDASMRSGRTRGGVPRLPDRLVSDAAGVHDGHVRLAGKPLRVPVREQALTHLLRVRLGDLASEKADRERRHGVGL